MKTHKERVQMVIAAPEMFEALRSIVSMFQAETEAQKQAIVKALLAIQKATT